MEQEPLVSISEASRIVGVSEATLRQWTDEGKLKAFITPGGHRRFSRSELRKFTSSPHKVVGIKDLVSEVADTLAEHREIGRSTLRDTAWYSQLSRESQELLALLGRRLLKLIERYVATPSKRDEVLSQAREVGAEMGEALAALGLGLTDTVEAFMMHRDPIMHASSLLTKKRAAMNRKVVEASLLIHNVMDEALVALVSAHQRYQGGPGRKPKGAPAR